jgi:hypothetical protein
MERSILGLSDLRGQARVEARVDRKIVIAPQIAEDARCSDDVVAARMRVTVAPEVGARRRDQLIEMRRERRAQPAVLEALRDGSEGREMMRDHDRRPRERLRQLGFQKAHRQHELAARVVRREPDSTDLIATIAIDLGKNVLHLVGMNDQGKVVLQA